MLNARILLRDSWGIFPRGFQVKSRIIDRRSYGVFYGKWIPEEMDVKLNEIDRRAKQQNTEKNKLISQGRDQYRYASFERAN